LSSSVKFRQTRNGHYQPLETSVDADAYSAGYTQNIHCVWQKRPLNMSK